MDGPSVDPHISLDAAYSRVNSLSAQFTDLSASLKQSHAELRRLHEEWMTAFDARQDCTTINRQLSEMRQQCNEQAVAFDALLTDLTAARTLVRQILHVEASRYKRPPGRFARLISRPLGTLPRFEKIEYDREEFAAAPSHRLLAVLTSLLASATLVTVTTLIPVTRASLVNMALGYDLAGTIVVAVVSVVLLVLIVRLIRNGLHSVHKFVFQSALEEEQWFRSGSESWSWPRRLYSCASFGFAHIVNLVYTFFVLGLLGLVGAAFMAVYLAEFRRTADIRKATVAAAKFHGQYNFAQLGVLTMVLLMYWLAMLADWLD